MEFERLSEIAREADLVLGQIQKGQPGNAAMRYLLERKHCKAVMFHGQPFFYDESVIEKDEAVRLLYLAFYGPKRFDMSHLELSARAQHYLYQCVKQRVEEEEWMKEAKRYNEAGYDQRLTDYFFDCCEREERIYGAPFGALPLSENEVTRSFMKRDN